MERIYIIEDDENIRNLLKIALEGFGYAAEGLRPQRKAWPGCGRKSRTW